MSFGNDTKFAGKAKVLLHLILESNPTAPRGSLASLLGDVPATTSSSRSTPGVAAGRRAAEACSCYSRAAFAAAGEAGKMAVAVGNPGAEAVRWISPAAAVRWTVARSRPW